MSDLNRNKRLRILCTTHDDDIWWMSCGCGRLTRLFRMLPFPLGVFLIIGDYYDPDYSVFSPRELSVIEVPRMPNVWQ